MLQSLSPSAMIQLSYTVTEHKYEPFTQIRKQGEDLHCIFAIVSGSLTLVHKFPGNSAPDVTLATLGSDTFTWFCRFFQLQGFRSLIKTHTIAAQLQQVRMEHMYTK